MAIQGRLLRFDFLHSHCILTASINFLLLCSIFQSILIPTTAFIRSPLSFWRTRTDNEASMLSFSHLAMSKDSAKDNGVQLASVESLDGDHELEGSKLSASIAAWLDQEVSLQTALVSVVRLNSFSFFLKKKQNKWIWFSSRSKWMPQEVHNRIGDAVKSVYVECRRNNEVDIFSIMVTTSEHLDQRWIEFENDGVFVNAWDVGNYVADYLIQRTSTDVCACSTPIVNPSV